MSQIYTLRTKMYFRSSLLSTQNLRKATTWNTSMCLQARSKELKCYCCCIFVSIHDSSCWYVPFYMHCRKFSVLSFCRRRQLIFHDTTMVTPWNNVWGGVYKRKLTPAWVSYRDDFLISYRIYMMTGSFHISLFEGTLHVDKIHVWFKITTTNASTTRSSLPADRFHSKTVGRFEFTWYHCEISYRSEILALVQEPGWTHTGVTHASMTFCGGIM